jgi:hypothetical protein
MQVAEFSPQQQKQVVFRYDDLKEMKKVSLA